MDEVHPVVYVDGIHLGRKAVVLIARSDQHVLGWYVARNENSRAWKALLNRIAPPVLVVCDGGSGFMKACKTTWPDTKIQRCVFHVFTQIKTATTTRPKLEPNWELYQLGKRLLHVKTLNNATQWLRDYQQWQTKWHAFLQEVTYHEHSWSYTHAKTVKACRSINSLIRNQLLFTYLDPLWDELMPATTNRIEGGVNAPLRQMLRDHRGLSLIRRIKAIFWWCYMHPQFPLPPAQILKVMPRDGDIENAYWEATRTNKIDAIIPRWGDTVAWHELHHTQPYRQDWD